MPVSWVADENIWKKAKRAASKSYKKSDSAYWPSVVTIYKKMGGKKKSTSSFLNKLSIALSKEKIRHTSLDKAIIVPPRKTVNYNNARDIINLLRKNPNFLKNVFHNLGNKIPKKYLKVALNRDVSTIRFITNPPEDIQRYAININPIAIRHIINPTEKIKKLAIRKGANKKLVDG